MISDYLCISVFLESDKLICNLLYFCTFYIYICIFRWTGGVDTMAIVSTYCNEATSNYSNRKQLVPPFFSLSLLFICLFLVSFLFCLFVCLFFIFSIFKILCLLLYFLYPLLCTYQCQSPVLSWSRCCSHPPPISIQLFNSQNFTPADNLALF